MDIFSYYSKSYVYPGKRKTEINRYNTFGQKVLGAVNK